MDGEEVSVAVFECESDFEDLVFCESDLLFQIGELLLLLLDLGLVFLSSNLHKLIDGQTVIGILGNLKIFLETVNVGSTNDKSVLSCALGSCSLHHFYFLVSVFKYN